MPANLAHGKLLVFGAYTTLGWRVVRHCTRARGESMVEQGEWRRVYSQESGDLLGYQLVGPDRSTKGDYDLLSTHAPAAISVSEMQVNAGCHGRSRTWGMSEDRRLERRDPEDAIERTMAKVAVWPFVGPRKGDVVRAWKLAGQLS
jgi:hypothetical protein